MNALDYNFVRANRIPTFRLEKPVRLNNADGSLISSVTHAALVDVSIDGHSDQVYCFITKIPTYALILGDPWLATHDPLISHKNRTMLFASEHCLNSGCLPSGRPCLSHSTNAPRAVKKAKGKFDIAFINAREFYRLARNPDCSAGLVYPKTGEDFRLCAATTNAIRPEDYDKFHQGKPPLSRKELLARLPQFLHSRVEAFMKQNADNLPEHNEEDHQIEILDGKEPPFARGYRPIAPQELEVVKQYIDELQAKGFIRPSSSPAASPVLIVRKPSGGLRVCIDYRGLNDVTIKNRYPIPNVNETLQKLRGCNYFTTLDVIAAFNRIRIAAGDEWKTAFTTRYGQFEYLVMPFGLCNAPGTFQSYINNSLKEYLDLWATAYLDDVLVFSKTLEEHEEHVQKVVDRLLARKLYIDIDKCKFLQTEVKYLGLIVGKDGIRMDPEKVETILEWEAPKGVKDV